MQKPNPVIKNYIYSSEKRVLSGYSLDEVNLEMSLTLKAKYGLDFPFSCKNMTNVLSK